MMSGLALRLSVIYAAFFMVTGIMMPYWPVWLQSRGLSDSEIGMLIAFGLVVRVLFGPFFGGLADRYRARRRVILGVLAASIVSFSLFFGVTGFLALLGVTVLFMAFHPTVLPMVEGLAGRAAASGRIDYGKVRLWGSMSFVAANLIGGRLLATYGVDSIAIAAFAFLFATFFACLLLPRDVSSPGETARTHLVPTASIVRLACHPVFIIFILSASLVQASHAVYYGFASIHWTRAGYDGDLIGALWAVGVIAEVVLFAFSTRFLSRLGPMALIALGGGAACVRWAVTAFDPPLAVLFVCQMGHAFTFGAAHMGLIQFIARAVPEALAASGQSLYTAFAGGIIMGAATVMSGMLYETWGAGAYVAMAVLGAAGAAGSMALLRYWDGQELVSVPRASG